MPRHIIYMPLIPRDREQGDHRLPDGVKTSTLLQNNLGSRISRTGPGQESGSESRVKKFGDGPLFTGFQTGVCMYVYVCVLCI